MRPVINKVSNETKGIVRGTMDVDLSDDVFCSVYDDVRLPVNLLMWDVLNKVRVLYR